MSIIQYKSTELVATTRKGKSVTLIIEDDKFEICFPEPLWEHIKDFLGIFDKVNRIDKPFLQNISFSIQYKTQFFIEKYLNFNSWDPEQRPISEALAPSLFENAFLSYYPTLTKQIYNRCLKDPTYCRLQALKWFQEPAPRRKGIIYPTRFASYDLEDLWDYSFKNYNKNGLYAPQYGPRFYTKRQLVLEKEKQKWMNEVQPKNIKICDVPIRVSISEMKAIIEKQEK
jgi:hypothetical protein